MIAPLFPDVVHVVARVDAGIGALRGRRVIVGEPRSGMRVAAEHLLGHHGLGAEGRDRPPARPRRTIHS